MKSAVGLTLAALAISLSAAPSAFAGPGRMDVGKRAPRVSTEEKAVLPESIPTERNEVLMDKRVGTELVPRKDAIVGERRSTIAVEETREKTFFRTPERKEYEVIERKENRWNGKESRFSTKEDAYRSKTAIRFQDAIGEASPVSKDAKPVVQQATTFDKINRFVFRKNGEQTVRVSTAGSEQPAADGSEVSSPAQAAQRAGAGSP